MANNEALRSPEVVAAREQKMKDALEAAEELKHLNYDYLVESLELDKADGDEFDRLSKEQEGKFSERVRLAAEARGKLDGAVDEIFGLDYPGEKYLGATDANGDPITDGRLDRAVKFDLRKLMIGDEIRRRFEGLSDAEKKEYPFSLADEFNAEISGVMQESVTERDNPQLAAQRLRSVQEKYADLLPPEIIGNITAICEKGWAY